jgi:two-component system OmpR family response regulator
MAQTYEPNTDLYAEVAPSTLGKLRVLHVDDVRLDLDGIALRVDGASVAITSQEFLLLQTLMDSAGRVVGREQLLNQVWGPDRGRMSNTLSVLMSRIRHKLLRPDRTSRIRTVRGVGYVFDTSPVDSQGCTTGKAPTA